MAEQTFELSEVGPEEAPAHPIPKRCNRCGMLIPLVGVHICKARPRKPEEDFW